MKHRLRSVCLISSGLAEGHTRLQPWRYLYEVARQLAAQGHAVTTISDGGGQSPTHDQLDGVAVQRVPTVSNPRWRANPLLQAAIQSIRPEVILWHLGLTSFLHQRLDRWPQISLVGIFPGLIYRPYELLRLGPRRILKGYRLSAIHVLGTLVPKALLRRSVQDGVPKCLVALTQTTGQRLIASGLPQASVKVIPPGVDGIWSTYQHNGNSESVATLGFDEGDTIIIYFGSPAPLRGLRTLIRALKIARRSDPSLRLLVLNRRRANELSREDAQLRRWVSQSGISQHVKVISGYLDRETLIRHVAASDVVALPFELVPADAPLSLLEVQALGKPVVITRVACLPELAAGGTSYLAEPADPASLARALRQAAAELRSAGGRNKVVDERSVHRPQVRTWQQMGEEWSHLIQSL